MEPIIELKNVTKTYRLGDETLHALDGVSFRVKPGEFIAITGPSGSGKSTMANIIGGLDHPNDGSVIVDGNELSHIHDSQLSVYRNAHIGFVFQSFNLQGTNTGLGDRLKHKPSQLSGGQRQRVAIARALAGKPKIIIADEPTGNLDSSKGQEIMQLLKDLNKQGITLLVITHDMNVARSAQRVVEIRDGKITEHRGQA